MQNLDLTNNLDPLLISVPILYPLKKPENQKAFGFLLFPVWYNRLTAGKLLRFVAVVW